jgi:hypothetical protein
VHSHLVPFERNPELSVLDASYRLTSPGLCAMVEKRISTIAQSAFSAHFCPASRARGAIKNKS